MLLRGLTHHTDRLFVNQTEEFELLSMQITVHLVVALLRVLSLDLLESLADISQCQIGWRVGLGASSPANWTPLELRVPAALQTVPAEAVAAWQQNRVLEDVAAHRTR